MTASTQEVEPFLVELAMAMPSEIRRQARDVFRNPSFVADLADDVRPDQIRRGVGARLGKRFLSVPTSYEIVQAIRSEIGAGSGHSHSASSEVDAWVNFLRDRFSDLRPGYGRANAKSLFMLKAPPEAKAIAFSVVPDAFPRDQDDRDHEQFWWDRIDKIFALPWLENQLGEAKGLLERLDRGAIKTAPAFVAAQLRKFLDEHEDVEALPLPRYASFTRVQTDDEGSPQPLIPVYPTPGQIAPPPRGPSQAAVAVMREVRGSRSRPPPTKLLPEMQTARQARESRGAADRQAARGQVMAFPVPRLPE